MVKVSRILIVKKEHAVLTDPWLWTTIVFAILFFGLSLFHFHNPYPLIQAPEVPHHLFFFENPRQRELLVRICAQAGHKPYGRFKSGVDQVLFRNGTTVFALKEEETPSSAITIPVKGCKNPMDLRAFVEEMGSSFELGGLHPDSSPVPGTEGTIIRLNLAKQLGFDILFRLPGRRMVKHLGFPTFARWRK